MEGNIKMDLRETVCLVTCYNSTAAVTCSHSRWKFTWALAVRYWHVTDLEHSHKQY